MSIAEQLIQRGQREGRQTGRQEGRLEGQIQLCQQMLGLPVSPAEELERKETSELQTLLRELEGRLRQRMK